MSLNHTKHNKALEVILKSYSQNRLPHFKTPQLKRYAL